MVDVPVVNSPLAWPCKVAVMVSLAIAFASSAALAQTMDAPLQPLQVDYTAPRVATLATYAKDFKLTGAAAVAFDGAHIWIARSDTSNSACSHCVTRISVDGKTVTDFPLRMTTSSGAIWASNPISIAFDGVDMWTANVGSHSVSRITPAGAVTHYTLPVSSAPLDIVFDGANMWTVNSGTHNVSRITPAGIVTTFGGLPANSAPTSIVFDGANLWTANSKANNNNQLSRFSSAASGANVAVTNVALPANSAPMAVAFDGTNIWAAHNKSTLSKVSRAGVVTANAVTLPSPCSAIDPCIPGAMALDQPGYSSAGASDPANSYVWVSAAQRESTTYPSGRGYLMKINAATNAVSAIHVVPSGLAGTGRRSMAFDGDHIWAVGSNRVVRIRVR